MPGNASSGGYSLEADEVFQPRLELHVMLCVLAAFSFVGTAGNGLVLYVFWRKKDKLVATVFILALAFVDFVTCLVVVPYTMYMEYSGFRLRHDFMCKAYHFLITSNIPFSALVMGAIAVDRYLCICHPLLRAINFTRAKVIVGSLAVFAAALGVLVALMHGVVFQRLDVGGTDNVTTPATATSAGLCRLTKAVIGGDVQWFFQKFYTALYLACFVVVFVLYVLIYRSVLARRVRRQRQKRATSTLVQTMTTAQRNDDPTAPVAGLMVDGDETMITMVPIASRDDNVVEAEPSVTNGGSTKKVKRWSWSTREKNRIANLKTAAILFVVTVVFVVTYLPAFLMTLMFIPYNMSVFYMYFANNIANPVIYSFMNKTFRDDLRKLYHRH